MHLQETEAIYLKLRNSITKDQGRADVQVAHYSKMSPDLIKNNFAGNIEGMKGFEGLNNTGNFNLKWGLRRGWGRGRNQTKGCDDASPPPPRFSFILSKSYLAACISKLDGCQVCPLALRKVKAAWNVSLPPHPSSCCFQFPLVT